nr:helix-turn-helix transcriptional regulator [Tenacibaculum todarodis]
MSQEDLANDADIPINQIGRIERAEINTSLLTILKITNALEISFLDFFQELENLSKTKTQD